MRATTVACRRGDRVPARSTSAVALRSRLILALVALLALTVNPAGSPRAQTVRGTVLFDEGICIVARARGCAKVMLDGAPFPSELFDTIDPYSIGAIVFLGPVDSGLLVGPNLGRSGTLLLFTERYVSRERP